jgi:hypothetical protein
VCSRDDEGLTGPFDLATGPSAWAGRATAAIIGLTASEAIFDFLIKAMKPSMDVGPIARGFLDAGSLLSIINE